MDEHDSFLRAIATDPGDDLPRLVYADFLEELGKPGHSARAHFIRAQIALTQLETNLVEFRETVALQNRLFTKYSEDWIWDLPQPMHSHADPAWRRGFIEFVRMPWEELLAAGALFGTVPITRVQAERSTGYTFAIRPAPHLRRITHLRIGPAMRPDSLDRDSTDAPGILQTLLTSEDFAELAHLDLSSNNINGGSIAAFAFQLNEAPLGRSLRTLDLSGLYGVDDAVGNALATARGLENLDRLSLRDCELGDAVRGMLRRRFGERVVF